MKLSLIRSMTRSAVFELENGLCFRPAHPFRVLLNGEAVYEAQNTNVFSLFSLAPATDYTVSVEAEGETLTLAFRTEDESFFVDASRYGLVADGETDNTGRLQAALSTCPKGGTVYVPAGRYRTSSLFLKSGTTLYLEKGAVLLGDNDRTHYPILPGVLPSENEVDEYYLTHCAEEFDVVLVQPDKVSLARRGEAFFENHDVSDNGISVAHGIVENTAKQVERQAEQQTLFVDDHAVRSGQQLRVDNLDPAANSLSDGLIGRLVELPDLHLVFGGDNQSFHQYSFPGKHSGSSHASDCLMQISQPTIFKSLSLKISSHSSPQTGQIGKVGSLPSG